MPVPLLPNHSPPEDINDLRDPATFFKQCRGQTQDKFYECQGCPYFSKPRTREQEIMSTGVDLLIVSDRPYEGDIPFPAADEDDVGSEFAAKSWWPIKQYIRNNHVRGAKNIRYGLTTAVMCYDKEKLTSDYKVTAIRQCSSILRRKIFHCKTKVVVLMGRQSCKASGVPGLDKVTSIDQVRGKLYKHRLGDRDIWYLPTHSLKDISKAPDLWSTVLLDFSKAERVFRKGFVKPPLETLTKDYVYPVNTAEVKAVLEPLIDSKKLIAFDLETTGLDPRAPDFKITVISFAWGKGKACAINTLKCSRESLEIIKRLLLSSTKKTAHNGYFDKGCIEETWGIKVNAFYIDTMLFHYILDENRSGGEERTLKGEYTLKKFVHDFIPEYGGYEEGVSHFFKSGKGGEIPEKDLLRYAAVDSDVTRQIVYKQLRLLFGLDLDADSSELKKKLNCIDSLPEKKLYKLAVEFMPRASHAINHMTRAGMQLDVVYLNKLLKEIPFKMKTIEAFVNSNTGLVPVTKKKTVAKQKITYVEKVKACLTNNKHIAYIIYTLPNRKAKIKTATGAPSTAQKTLQYLFEETQDPIVEAILTYKKLSKLHKSFLTNLRDLKSSKTGRVHPQYRLTGTVTGRLSCSSPNLQQMPMYIKLPDKSRINLKKVFQAAPGNVFVYSDYSQMEMVILASMAARYGDTRLKDAIIKGLDIHCYIASQVFNISYKTMFQKAKVEEVKEYVEYRNRAKTVGFALVYGSTAWGMAKKQGIAIQEAQDLIDNFFHSFPGVKKYITRAHQEARDCGYVTSEFGRRRRFPITQVRNYIDGSVKRKAQNYKIQSCASDICLKAVTDLTENVHLVGGKVVVTVHDSIIVEVRDDPIIIQKTVDMMKKYMLEKPMQEYDFLEGTPLKSDYEVGYNWGEMKKYEDYFNELDSTT